MPLFDLPTVITYSGLMACVMGLILLFLGKNYPDYIKGVRLWAVAPLLASAAVFSRVWLRSMAPDDVAIGAQNVCLIATAVFFLAGAREFFEQPLRRYSIPVLIGMAALAMWLFSGHEGAAVYRRLFARSYLIGLYACLAWTIWRQPRSFATHLGAGLVTALVVLLLTRTVVGYLSPDGDGVDSHAMLQLVYAVGFSSTDVLIPICAILMITERTRSVLETLATRDGLTGLLTRRALFELAEGEFAGCRRRGSPLTVMMMDLDHFKDINDTYGHQIGDEVIRDFAAHAQAVIRRPYLMGRYGGEEFVVLLPNVAVVEATGIAERIRQNSHIVAGERPCSVSIGIAALQPDTPSLDALIRRADEGLYRAKQLGRNRVELAA